MKTKITLIVCVFIPLSFFSCKREKHIEYYESGIIQSVFYTRNHKFVGELVTYHEDGSIWEKGHFRFNHQSGLWLDYYPNGDVMCKRRYFWGKLLSINAWAKDGTQTVVDGTGVMVDYYDTGAISGITSYKGNRLDGEMSTWYETGIKSFESFYEKGKPVGITKCWSNIGELEYTREYLYSNDTAYCVDKFYYPNGTIKEEQRSCNKTNDVLIRKWDEEGSLISE